jgi:hypothetical protein
MTDDREFDDLLDRALASYVDEEPDASLRARILAQLDGAARRPRWMWWSGALAASAAALLIAFLLHPAAHPPSPSAGNRIAGTPQSAALPSTAAMAVPQETVRRHAAVTVRRRNKINPPTLQRSDSFPSPTPLTAEESLLLKFATEHPAQAQQVLTITAQDRAPLDTKPLSIEPIRIAALSDSQETHPWQ